MKCLILIPLLASLAVGQADERHCWHGVDNGKPVEIPCDTVPKFKRTNQWTVVEAPRQSWVDRHPTKTKVLFVIGGGAIGGIVAYKTRLGSCAKFYDGKPYVGTPPCPK